jgi:ketosteroid isomerase-like protein
MSKRYLLLLSAILACAAWYQPTRHRASASASDAAAEVLALEHKIEDAVVRGDVAFVDSVLAADFSFVHGDGWTTGGKPLAVDDKAAFLRRVAEREYLVHDLDDVKTEVHGDIVITYGRYVSLYMPKPQNAIPNATPGRLNSIWFERVYAKRPSVNGQWQFLSHRTVHGPTVSPAGVDPTQILPGQAASYVTGLPRAKVKAETYPAGSKEAVEVLEVEKAIGAAIVRGDVAYFDHATSPDFVMVHGDGWTRGGKPALVDDKNSFLKRIASHLYAAHDFDSVKVEMHGDIAITYGRYVGNIPSSGEGRAWFAVWYEKIYARRDGRWIYLSHRTVHGATYGLDRQSVSDK